MVSKRTILRVTAGGVIATAWAVAGVYAFWGDKGEDSPTPPAVDATAMSAQIAAVQQEKNAAEEKQAPPAPTFVRPVAAQGDEATSPATSAQSLFNAGKRTSPTARGGAFQPASAPPDEGATSRGYGEVEASTPEISVTLGSRKPAAVASAALGDDPTSDVGANPESFQPEPDPTTEENPLRARGALGAATAAAAADLLPENTLPEAETPAVRNELPSRLKTSPPPSRFAAAETDQDPASVVDAEEPTPALRERAAPPAAFPARRAAPITRSGIIDDSDAGGSEAQGGAGFQNSYGGSSRIPKAAATAGALASARPGERALEGSQAPALVIEKFAPPEIQVGKPATFEIHVKNTGASAARQVVVTDHVPQGTKFVSAKPEPQAAATGALVWQLGTVEPGAAHVIALELLPEAEGEIGSVAEVSFAAAASAKSVSTRPLLAVEHILPSKVLIGETVTMQISITNPGTGVATGVVLQEDVPEGLSHSAGRELEYEVGTLRPGETRKLELALVADKAGTVKNTLVVRGDANLTATHSTSLEVLAPQLALEMAGPKRRYLDRQATYTVSVANPGTATARDVEIVAYLPKGMKFVSTDREGQYDAQHHAVYWSLAELPAAQKGSAQLIAIPVEEGEQKLRVEGHAQLGLAATDEKSIVVEAIPQLVFEIVDEADPIEIGAETVYQVRVTNTGSKTATNVQVVAALPPELRPVSAEGATRGSIEGQNAIFEPLGKLAPQAEAVFKIQATGLRTGDYTMRVQVASDEQQTPVTKEEHTRVYADR